MNLLQNIVQINPVVMSGVCNGHCMISTQLTDQLFLLYFIKPWLMLVYLHYLLTSSFSFSLNIMHFQCEFATSVLMYGVIFLMFVRFVSSCI